jgi:hypothetical protein
MNDMCAQCTSISLGCKLKAHSTYTREHAKSLKHQHKKREKSPQQQQQASVSRENLSEKWGERKRAAK